MLCLMHSYEAIQPTPEHLAQTREQFICVWDCKSLLNALPILQAGGPNLAVLDGRSSGIQFGAEGLTIGLQPSQVTMNVLA